jgi:EAL domain-containing protein (putative c-di-GMP-specific phosphodiesterase class I)
MARHPEPFSEHFADSIAERVSARVDAMLSLARNLGLQASAEGVENLSVLEQ